MRAPAVERRTMRTLIVSFLGSLLFLSTFSIIPAHAQENALAQAGNDAPVEGTVVSSTRNTLVVKGDDNEYHLFTYNRSSVKAGSLVAGTRVRVTAGAPDDNGTRNATDVAVLDAKGTTPDKSAKRLPSPTRCGISRAISGARADAGMPESVSVKPSIPSSSYLGCSRR